MGNNVENLIKSYKGNGIPKIDMHAHYLPQAYKEELLKKFPDIKFIIPHLGTIK